MPGTEPTFLPGNWRELKNSEKFAALRDSPNLFRGSILDDVEVDCRKYKIEDRNARFAFRFNRPSREDGSYTFRKEPEHPATGRLDIAYSGAPPYERIYVISEAMTSEGGKSVPRSIKEEELGQIASLLMTFDNRCDAPSGHPIQTYVLLAKRER